MTALKTKFLKYIDSVTNEEHLYEVIPPAPTETERGGIIASPKTDLDTAEAKLGEDGKLYVNASVQIPADWNQNDETAQDYVKNRTHWAETEEIELVSKTSFEGQQYICDVNINAFVIGETYSVKFDGVLYEGIVCEETPTGFPAIGATNNNAANKYPFVVAINNGEAMIMAKDNTEHTIRVYQIKETIHKLDEKYLNVAGADEALALLMEEGLLKVYSLTGEDILTTENGSIFIA